MRGIGIGNGSRNAGQGTNITLLVSEEIIISVYLFPELFLEGPDVLLHLNDFLHLRTNLLDKSFVESNRVGQLFSHIFICFFNFAVLSVALLQLNDHLKEEVQSFVEVHQLLTLVLTYFLQIPQVGFG